MQRVLRAGKGRKEVEMLPKGQDPSTFHQGENAYWYHENVPAVGNFSLCLLLTLHRIYKKCYNL